eukprot:753776-Hanusia_phi.AAC.9
MHEDSTAVFSPWLFTTNGSQIPRSFMSASCGESATTTPASSHLSCLAVDPPGAVLVLAAVLGTQLGHAPHDVCSAVLCEGARDNLERVRHHLEGPLLDPLHAASDPRPCPPWQPCLDRSCVSAQVSGNGHLDSSSSCGRGVRGIRVGELGEQQLGPHLAGASAPGRRCEPPPGNREAQSHAKEREGRRGGKRPEGKGDESGRAYFVEDVLAGSSQENGACLGFFTVDEEREILVADLLHLKDSALSSHVALLQFTRSVQNGRTRDFGNTVVVCLPHPPQGRHSCLRVHVTGAAGRSSSCRPSRGSAGPGLRLPSR